MIFNFERMGFWEIFALLKVKSFLVLFTSLLQQAYSLIDFINHSLRDYLFSFQVQVSSLNKFLHQVLIIFYCILSWSFFLFIGVIMSWILFISWLWSVVGGEEFIFFQWFYKFKVNVEGKIPTMQLLLILELDK